MWSGPAGRRLAPGLEQPRFEKAYALHDMFLGTTRTNWYGDREHEWARGPARFRRYTLESGPWQAVAAEPAKEGASPGA